MKAKTLLFLFSILFLSTFAQEKTLKIEDYRNSEVYPKQVPALHFKGETDTYLYANTTFDTLYQAAIGKNPTVFITLTSLNTALQAVDGEAELKALPEMIWETENIAHFAGDEGMWKYDMKTQKATKEGKWLDGSEDQDIAGNGNVAFTKEGDLYVLNVHDGKVKTISEDGEYQIVYGKAGHRSEFGIVKGTFWSPSGKKLAFTRMDQSMVTDYILSDYKQLPAAEEKIKYPMAGSKSHHVTTGVYDVNTGKTIYLETGEPKEKYSTNVTWSPDEKNIYVAIVNRDQNEMKLNRYDAATGKFEKTLFEEKHPKYVEPEHGPIFLPDGKTFLWFSERDDWQHIYWYEMDGTLKKQLTKGDWMVEELLGMDKKGECIFFTATKDGAISMHAYKLILKSGEIIPLTPAEGTHNVQISKSGNVLIDNYSNLTTPSVTQIIDTEKNKVSKVLLTAPNPLSEYKVGQVSFFPLKSNDGKTDLYCRLIKPAGFDPSQKYPVMVYVYGGPHAQMVHNSWLAGADMFLMYMASQGYVVFTMDNRGSGGRGLAFENVTHRELGKAEVDDQSVGIEWLKKQTYVDASRMGCFGWSFGGFMTTSMMLKKPDYFKAAVAGGPVIDWKFYEVMYTERYMDTPEQNPDGYKNSALTNYVTNLKGKLLLIHGLKDDTVVPQHTAAFINECVAKGVLVDYFPYPNHAHNVRGKDRIHLYKKVEDYFKRNL